MTAGAPPNPRASADPSASGDRWAGADPQAGTDPWASALLGRLTRGRPESPITHLEQVPAREGRTAPWPPFVPDLLTGRLQSIAGIVQPWEHQARAATLAWSGRSVVVATGTASGKSLAYQLPVLSALLTEPRATALYLSPTKALAADQLWSLTALQLTDVRAATYDGDTGPGERDWVRAHARLVLTNPDMLHRGILPRHARWQSFLRRLRFVVVDECHGYRGVFGSHVAHVLRRLRRVCARYGATPTFVLASATVSAPAESASLLTGVEVTAVDDDASPRAGTSFALWEPAFAAGYRGENDAPVRRTATAEASRILADLVVEGVRTLAFVRSRRGAEVVALSAQRMLAEAAPELADRVAAYRSGFLPGERRELEAALRSGQLLGLASTNALELGVDIAGLDAVVLTGYPGTLASLWQQAGRAGRTGRPALAVFVARDDPLDTYLAHHPDAVFGRPIEATVLDPDNPYVLGPQLACAAADLPLTEEDLSLFGADIARPLLADLVRRGLLRHRPTGWYWTSKQRPAVDIRGVGGDPVRIVEAATGRLLGTVDAGSAHGQVHTGALHLQQGRSYVVDELDLAASVALVHAEEPDWTTSARDITEIAVVDILRTRDLGHLSAHLGTVDVTNLTVSYLRKRVATGEVLDERPLDLPPRQLRTRAVWYTVAVSALGDAGLDAGDIPGAAHAAEHAAIGLLPLFATCDRWDIGGVSTALHADTGRTTVFVYDGYPGGAGFAARGYDVLPRWLAATREAVAACGCESGCPSCVQSPKCGNGNAPLSKGGAVRLLDIVLDRLGDRAGPVRAGPHTP